MDKHSSNSLQEIEAGLQRLMPKGLSDLSRDELETVIDELASKSELKSAFPSRQNWLQVAAVITLGGVAVWSTMVLGNGRSNSSLVEAPALSGSLNVVEQAFEVLEQRTWIESGTDLGMQTIDQGGELSRGWSYTGVEEERLLNERSGYEVILQREFEAELYAATSL